MSDKDAFLRYYIIGRKESVHHQQEEKPADSCEEPIAHHEGFAADECDDKYDKVIPPVYFGVESLFHVYAY